MTVLTTLVAMISPGPDMLFILGCGMRGGARAGLLATALRIAGAGYLIYLGVRPSATAARSGWR